MADQLIFGTDNCTTFFSELSGKEILFNDDPDRFRVLSIPSQNDVTELLLRYIQLRISDIWGGYGRVVTLGEKTGLAAFTNGANNRMFHIRGSYLMSKLPGLYEKQGKGKPYEGINQFISTLSIQSQQEILQKVRPTDFEELKLALIEYSHRHAMAYSPLTLINERYNFASLLLRLISEIRQRKSIDQAVLGPQILARHQDILSLMALEGWILFPVRYGTVGVISQYDRFFLSRCYLREESFELIENAYRMLGASLRDSENGKRSLRTFFFSSNVRCIEDLSPAIVSHFDRFIATKMVGSTSAKSGAKVVGDILRTISEHKYPDRPFGNYRNKENTTAHNKKSSSFKLVETSFPNRPDLHHWAALFAKYVEGRATRNIVHVVYHLWRFINYLEQRQTPIENPGRILRHLHIRDRSGTLKTTYFSFLQSSKGAPRPKNAAMQELRRFFDWYLDYQVSAEEQDKLDKNPVNTSDTLGTPKVNLGMSHRLALPEFILDEIKSTITANDFEFPRSRDLDYFETIDQAGKPTRVWFPGTAICMYFLVDQPVRLKQARWLDDGSLDEDSVTIERVGVCDEPKYIHRIVRNQNPARIAGRRQGVLRAINDFGQMEQFIGLFINTNKTDYYDGFSPNGKEIPYVPPQLLELLIYMRDWQQQWMPPLDSLVPYLEGEDLNDKYRDKVPMVSPLFRDPLGPSRRQPVSDHRLRRFYTDVMQETERRLQRKGYAKNNGFNIQLTRETHHSSGKRYTSSIYDVHTLRVSGITALLNRGVPIEVVSHSVAHHKTLAMTLWYYKPTPGQCREVLLDAYSKRRDEFSPINGDFAKSPEFQSNWQAYAKHFLSNVRRTGESDALRALDEGKGVWRIQVDGICPGTECATGFLYETEHGKGYYGAVPGGKTCSLCRYWITGPMFLLGQTIKMNSVMVIVEKKAHESRTLKDVARVQETSGNWTALHATRSRLHELDQEMEIHVNDWHARLRFTSKSIQQLEDYRATRVSEAEQNKAMPVPWINSNTLEELNIVLQDTDSFVLLDSVMQGIQFVPGLANTEEKLDHQRLINSILRKGGAKHLLLDLPDDIAGEAGNILSSKLIQAASSNGVDIRKILDGEISLRDLTVVREGQAISLLDDLNTILDDASRSHVELSKPLRSTIRIRD